MPLALTFELRTPLKPFPDKAEREHPGNFKKLTAVYLWVHNYLNNSFCKKKKKNVLKRVKLSGVSIVRTFDKLFLLLYDKLFLLL